MMTLSFDVEFKARIVTFILQNKPEEALSILSRMYSVKCPSLKIGRIKRLRNSLGVYAPSKNTIYVSSSDLLNNPSVILHEFYHHLRCVNGKHRGTERYAKKFENDFIASYIDLQRKKK